MINIYFYFIYCEVPENIKTTYPMLLLRAYQSIPSVAVIILKFP